MTEELPSKRELIEGLRKFAPKVLEDDLTWPEMLECNKLLTDLIKFLDGINEHCIFPYCEDSR